MELTSSNSTAQISGSRWQIRRATEADLDATSTIAGYGSTDIELLDDNTVNRHSTGSLDIRIEKHRVAQSNFLDQRFALFSVLEEIDVDSSPKVVGFSIWLSQDGWSAKTRAEVRIGDVTGSFQDTIPDIPENAALRNTISSRPAHFHIGDVVELQSITVDVLQQLKGWGKKLFQHGKDKVSPALIRASADPDHRKFFAHMGFGEARSRTGSSHPRDLVEMWFETQE